MQVQQPPDFLLQSLTGLSSRTPGQNTITSNTGLTVEEFKKKSTVRLSKLNVDEECGICLEEFKVREVRTYPCLNHVAHKDCFK